MKTKISPKEAEVVFNNIVKLIDTYIQPERHDNIMKLFDDLLENIINAPASSSNKFHCAFRSGWLIHTLNVMENALKVDKLWCDSGFGDRLYTLNELMFSALFHDLYKIGFSEEDGGQRYIPQTNQWKIDNYGQLYTTSKEGLNAFPPEEGTMMLLSKYNLIPTKNEIIGIKCADGSFSTHWKEFFPDFTPLLRLNTNIHLVVHQADFMSTFIESRMYD